MPRLARLLLAFAVTVVALRHGPARAAGGVALDPFRSSSASSYSRPTRLMALNPVSAPTAAPIAAPAPVRCQDDSECPD